MALFRTLNTLRRDAVNLALHTLGLKKSKGRGKSGKPQLYRTYDLTAVRRPAVQAQPLLLPSSLLVSDVVCETADAVSVVLANPDGQAINFRPGMFYTVVVTIDGQEYRRAYSISSAAHHGDKVAITVKRVAGGLVSNWINDHLKAGDTLRVLGPSGNFTITPDASQARNLVLVGAGSGITPLMSITRSLLETEPLTRIHLQYGNRSLDDIIFRDALSMLEQEYDERLSITHVLETPPEEWQGEVGRLDRATFARLLDGILTDNPLPELEVYTCGPEPVMKGVEEEVLSRGLPPSRFHQEKFTPAAGPADASRFTAQPVEITLNGKSWAATAQPGQTLLEAGLAAGAPVQFSCTLGGCGRCRVKVTQGEVDMPEPNCLLPEEKAQHYALSCIARACTPVSFEIDPPQSH